MDIALVNTLSGHRPEPEKEDKKLKEATRDFEAILIGYMLKSMRDTVPEDSLLGNSHAKGIYQSMADEQLANHIARGNNSLGIGEALYKELSGKISPDVP